MDTLDFIFFFIGIVGFILSIVSEIIIKIDDIMTDKKIDRYFNSIGVSGSKKWNHPVYNRLQDDHYIFAASMDKTKFFFYLCEVIGLQLSVVKAGFYPIDLNLMDLIAVCDISNNSFHHNHWIFGNSSCFNCCYPLQYFS